MTDEYYEVQPAYVEAPQFSSSDANISGGIDENGHMAVEDVWGSERKVFHIKTPVGCTLEQLAASKKKGIRWMIPTELKQMLRHVNKKNNRSVASAKDLDGDLGKLLFLSATVIRDYSNCAKDLAFDIDGFVPEIHGDTGRHAWVIPAGNGVPSSFRQDILNPDNIFTTFMYDHDQKCNLKTLSTHINLNQDPNKQMAGMTSKGVGWKVLLDNLNIPDGPYANSREGIYAQNKHIIDHPESKFNQIAQVPYEVAVDIYDAIAKPLKEIEKSYVDMNKWGATITPDDGLAWNSTVGLCTDGMAYGSDSTGVEVESRLNTPFKAGIFLEVKLVFN